MSELVVGGKPIVPIRAIPFHTGNCVDVRDTAGLLCDPETYGQITGIGLVAYYVDALGVPHSMWPLEFKDMASKVAELLKSGEQQMGLIEALLPGVFVYRADLEQCLDGFWHHYSDRSCSLGQGEYQFNPAPRMTTTEEFLVYAGFEDLRTGGTVLAGTSYSHAEKLEDVRRVLRRLTELAAEENMPLNPGQMPGRMQELVALVRRHSRAMNYLQPDAVRSYINEAGFFFKSGRPSKDATPHALYRLM